MAIDDIRARLQPAMVMCVRSRRLHGNEVRRSKAIMTSRLCVAQRSTGAGHTTATPSSPVLPSSPPVIEHAAASIASPSEDRTTDSSLLTSPELPTRQNLPPRTPVSPRTRPYDNSSEYFTAIWGSPYDRSPPWSRSARSALSQQILSEANTFEDLASSPGPDFGLEHLLPRRLSDLNLPQLVVSQQDRSPDDSRVTKEEESALTPRSRTKRWVQLPRSEPSEETTKNQQWWKDEHHTHETRTAAQRHLAPSPKLEESNKKQHPALSAVKRHKPREANRTLNQQSFLDILKEAQAEEKMASGPGLMASRWADPPPPEDEDILGGGNEGAIIDGEKARLADSPPLDDSEVNIPEKAEDETPADLKAEKEDTEDKAVTEEVETKDPAQSEPIEKEIEAQSEAEDKSESENIPEAAPETEKVEDASPVAQEKETEMPSEMDTSTAGNSKAEASEPEQSEILSEPATPARRLEAPRLKKRISWRAKTCVISIPNVDFEALGLPKPMSQEEIQARLKSFEDAGYNTSGFDAGYEGDTNVGQAHVRPIYPDEGETHVQSGREQPRVTLPDLKKWAAYMDWLTEQKLAALGVTTGMDEPAPAPTPATEMSRQSSAQYPPLPFSPPLPTASAQSIGRPGMMRGHQHTMSVASPISPANAPFGHSRGHSTFAGPFGGFNQMPSQSPIPGMQPFSPHQQFALPNFPRAGSPAGVAGLRQDLNSSRGAAASPLQHSISPQPPQDFGSSMFEGQRRGHGYSQSVQPTFNSFAPMFNQNTNNNNMNNSMGNMNNNMNGLISPNSFSFNANNTSGFNNNMNNTNSFSNSTSSFSNANHPPVLPELPEEDDEEELQEREEEPAEEKLEEEKPEPVSTPERPAYVPPQKRAEINADIVVPTPRHRHNISQSLELGVLKAEERHEASRKDWIEVTEEDSSRSDSTGDQKKLKKVRGPAEEKPAEKSTKEGTESKRNSSRFNADAPSFEFNPKASFQPFQPPTSTAFTFGAPEPKSDDHSRRHSRRVSSGNFNVAAPVFMPSSDFNFSASVSSLADAPKPRESFDGSSSKIFGDIDIPDIVKPPRRSKAVSIVRPSTSSRVSASGTDFEDEEGRIAPSEDRLKRQRKAGGDGDEVPQFAEPTPMPDAADFVPKSADKEIQPESKLADTQQAAWRHGHKSSRSSLSALAKPFAPPGGIEEDKENVPDDSFTSNNDLEDGEIREDDYPIFSGAQPRYESVVTDANGQVPKTVEPSFDEIDAVMQHLNDLNDIADESGEKEDVTPLSPIPSEDGKGLSNWSRNEVPSTSPKRKQIPYKTLVESGMVNRKRSDSTDPEFNPWPGVHHLQANEEAHVSDWSGVLSDDDEEKIQQRSRFFDGHIDSLIDRVIERRLLPLESGLKNIQQAVMKRPRTAEQYTLKKSSPAHSDADDEDDVREEFPLRPMSRGRDKYAGQIKAAVMEALKEQTPQANQPSNEIADLHAIIADMKVSFARAASNNLELEDVRAIIDEALSKKTASLSPLSHDDVDAARAHKRELSELEGRLNETLAGALEEANHRRAVEERENELKRQLRVAEEELAILREAADDEDDRFAAIEEAKQNAEDQVERLQDETKAMEDTLEEYRISSNKWRQGIDEGKIEREELETTITGLERQLVESQDASSGMRARLEKLYAAMTEASGQLASEKAIWKNKEEDYRAKSDAYDSQKQAFAHERQELESQIRILRASAHEASESKLALDQMRTSNGAFEEMVRKLQIDLMEHQSTAARSQREVLDVKEAGRAEVERSRISFETDAESTKHQHNVERTALESELVKLRAELESVRLEGDSAKERHERTLQDEDGARKDGLRKTTDDHNAIVEETRRKHEAEIHELNVRHARELEHAVEDKQRAETHLGEKLALSDSKVQHHQERVQHLEERLEVAKSAAQAAVLNAQGKPTPGGSTSSTTATSTLPEKISPQALRESILVLQEQLQERESRIDELESKYDPEAANNIKEKDAEISWLRELLGLRSEELADLVNTLSQPTFNREVLRDTAIRIRANLQMEQQEKERFANSPASLGGQALASLSQFASPRAAAGLSSAFNKWRLNMESNSLKGASRASTPGRTTPSRAALATRQKPSRIPSGLMTPPASNLRDTPSPEPTTSLPAPRLQSRNSSGSADMPRSEPSKIHDKLANARRQSSQLFRTQSYDRDAEDSKVDMENFEDDDLSIDDSQAPAFRSLDAELEAAGGADDEDN